MPVRTRSTVIMVPARRRIARGGLLDAVRADVGAIAVELRTRAQPSSRRERVSSPGHIAKDRPTNTRSVEPITYGFASFDTDGSPVTWPYNEPITVALEPRGMAYTHFIRDASQAIKRINLVGGFRLRLIGHDGSRLDEAKIIIRWLPRREMGNARHLGEAQTSVAGSPGERRIVHGDIRLSSNARLGPGFRPRGWGAVLLHELLHALGAAHCQDPNQVMYEQAGRVGDLGVGDRYVLRMLAEVARQKGKSAA